MTPLTVWGAMDVRRYGGLRHPPPPPSSKAMWGGGGARDFWRRSTVPPTDVRTRSRVISADALWGGHLGGRSPSPAPPDPQGVPLPPRCSAGEAPPHGHAPPPPPNAAAVDTRRWSGDTPRAPRARGSPRPPKTQTTGPAYHWGLVPHASALGPPPL